MLAIYDALDLLSLLAYSVVALYAGLDSWFEKHRGLLVLILKTLKAWKVQIWKI